MWPAPVDVKGNAWGSPPLAAYLDAMMRHLGRPSYYVGLLTAAEWHGATHYAVQEVQVVVPAQLRPLRIGRDSIRFVTKKTAAETPVERMATDFGFIRVSSRGATAIDLIQHLGTVGGVSVVATLLGEMMLDPDPLRTALDAAGDITAAQRLGYLLEQAGQKKAANVVSQWLSHHRSRPRPLDPDADVQGTAVAPRWSIHVNTHVEVSR